MTTRRFALALLLAGLAAALSVSLARAESADAGDAAEADRLADGIGVEVRLAAQVDADGVTRVGIQYRTDSEWSEITSPRRHILPDDSEADRWLVTNAFAVSSRQATVSISTKNRNWTWERRPEQFVVEVDGARYETNCGWLELVASDVGVVFETRGPDCSEWVWNQFGEDELAAPSGAGEQELRILARRLSDGGVELGLQRRVNQRWLSVELPQPHILSADQEAGVWGRSDTVSLPLPPPIVRGTLRNGATVRAVPTTITLEVDGVEYTSSCGTLRLRALADSVLAYTVDRDCANWIALGTVCPSGGAADCDVQRAEVYEWEFRQLNAAGIDGFELTVTEAQTLVDAIFEDYFGSHRRKPAVLESDEQFSYYTNAGDKIYLQLNDWAYPSLIHELAHALLDAAGLSAVSHDPEFPRLLLHLWERYLPIIDLPAAVFDASVSGVSIAEPLRPSPRSDRGITSIETQLCGTPAKSARLCLGFTDTMAALDAAALSGAYIGRGGDEDLWWGAEIDEASGGLGTYVARHIDFDHPAGAAARLSIECTPDDRLSAEVWWKGMPPLDSLIRYQVGSGGRVSERWRVGEGTWGDETWSYHVSLEPEVIIQAMHWGARSDAAFRFSYVSSDATYEAVFPLAGMFATPAQVNLAQCGGSREPPDPAAVVTSSSRYDAHFWWGARAESDGTTRTFIALESHLVGAPNHIVRMQLTCRSNELRFGTYWDVSINLDPSVRYKLGSQDFVSEEWGSSTGTWGDQEFKWVGPRDASTLIAQLAWASAAGHDLTLETHAQGNRTQTYNAVFDLDGLFETPVQPNLARCGR